MTAVRQDFDFFIGTTKTVTFTVTSGGSPYDLSSLAVTWALSRMPNESPTVTKTESDGITIVDAGAGTCSVQIDAGDITQPGLYYHALKVSDGSSPEVVTFGRVMVFGNPE